MEGTTDRIEREILIKAPRSRVWRALTNAEEFGRWFRVNLKGADFAPGKRIEAEVTYPGYEHLVWDVVIERMEPERVFSWRWHPEGVERGMDYSGAPTTLVEFTLREVEGGTALSVVESGFDKVPPERRLAAFRMNSEGWDIQLRSIDNYVAAA